MIKCPRRGARSVEWRITAWTGNLTVGTRMIFSQTVYGWDGQNRYTGASLSDDEFSLGGDTCALDEIYIAGPTLTIAFELGNAGDIATQATRNALVLHIGNDSFNLGAGTLASNQRGISWSSNVPTWANGDAACRALTAIPPDVSSVELTSDPNNNTYAIGDEIEATVTFSAAVDITGTPQLELDFAGTPKPAACAAATNTTTMVCSYTVAVNDSAPNGIAIAANKLTLNGGTIRATGSTTLNADLDHGAVAIDAGQKVDGTQVILTFSETIGSADRTKITIAIGGGQRRANERGESGWNQGRTRPQYHHRRHRDAHRGARRRRSPPRTKKILLGGDKF